MARIFLTGSGVTKGYATGSGIITNPARILLQERDNATGSYPTIARTGDPDFTGQYASTFDDTNTIIFSGGNLVYPTNLPASSKFVSGGVATPNILQGLTAAGTSSAGTADAHVSFTPGENISPFDESRIYIDNDAEFYATGTASGTLPGFSQRLSSKTSFTIDINPTTSTDVVFSTGTLPGASGYDEGVNSGIAYFNFADKRWEVIGDLATGNNVDYYNDNIAIMTSSMLAVMGAQYYSVNTSPDPQIFNQAQGAPSDFAGFPYATKFNPTGSQLFNIDNLTTAFLLEKISIEFSGTLRNYGYTGNGTRQIQNSTFILMLQRQKDIPSAEENSYEIVTGTSSPNLKLTVSQSNFSVDKDRKIISYGRIGKFFTGSYASVNELKLDKPETYASSDLWLAGGSIDTSDNDITGKFTVNFKPKIPAIYPTAGVSYRQRTYFLAPSNQKNRIYLGRQKSGRGLRNESDGRSFIRSVIGNKIDQFVGTGLETDQGIVRLRKYENESEESPFILLPNDKLILAYINQPWPLAVPGFPNFPESQESFIVANYKNTLLPGAGKITLFGSLLQDNLPKEPESNQPLTSDAIHEDLHYDNPVYDQWDVEPFAALTGSYTDLVITGSMLAQNSSGEYADPEAPNVRKVQASVAAGQAGTTGSLQRFVRLTAAEGKVYDSYPPNAQQIINSVGKGYYANYQGTDVFSAVGIPSGNVIADANTPLSGVDQDWYLRHAYENISQRSVFDTSKDTPGEAFNNENTSFGIRFPNFFDTVLVLTPTRGSIASGSSPVDTQGNLFGEATRKEKTKALFGFGDDVYNVPRFINGTITNNQIFGQPLIRGYKYGLGGLFGSLPDARFRRDRYGQFRDMLEQRRFPATLVGGIVEYPVEIKFVPQDSTTGGSEDPARTHSQNLSPFATSSLPYYDGQVKDRGDDPDVTLTPIEVSV